LDRGLRSRGVSIGEMSLPVIHKIDDALAALHRQRRYGPHLVAIRDVAVILRP